MRNNVQIKKSKPLRRFPLFIEEVTRCFFRNIMSFRLFIVLIIKAYRFEQVYFGQIKHATV